MEEGIAMMVDPGGLLVYGGLEMLLKYIVEAIRAVEKRVVSKVCRRCGKDSNIFSLGSDAPGTAKS